MKKLLLSLVVAFAATAVHAQVAMKPISSMPKADTGPQANKVEKMERMIKLPLMKAAADLPTAPVTTRPEGRSEAYHLESSTLYTSNDGGTVNTPLPVSNTYIGMEMVYDADGETVWLKGALPMSTYTDSWLKGTLTDGGSRILVPAGQVVGQTQGYLEEGKLETFNVRLFLVSYTPSDDGMVMSNLSMDQIPYVVDGDKIRLDLPADGTLATGEVITRGSGESMMFYSPQYATYATTFERMDMQKTELPAGIAMQDYIVSYTGGGGYTFTAKVGISGQDIYLADVFHGIEDDGVAVKGTFDGDKAVFPAGQLLTLYSGYWFHMQPCVQAAGDAGQTALEQTDEIVFTYDRESGMFTSDGTMSIINDFAGALTVDGLFSSPTLSPLEAMRAEGLVESYRLSAATGYAQDDNGYITFDVNPYIGMEIVYGKDGQSVWMKNIAPIPSGSMDLWLRGKLADGGSRILVPAGQMVNSVAQLYAMAYNAVDGKASPTNIVTDDIPYVIDGDEIRLDLPADGSVAVGAVTISDGTPYVYDPGMFGMVFNPMEMERTVPPAGLATEDYVMSAGNAFGEESKTAVKVAIDGTDIYIGGVFSDYMSGSFISPEAIWIKGTFDGSKATFRAGQLIVLAFYWYYMQPFRTAAGDDGGSYYEPIDELTFDYNEATHTFNCGDILAANIYNSFNTGVYFPYISPTLTRTQSTGIQAVEAGPEGEPVKTEYYTLSGMKVSRPSQGIYIRTTTYADGTRKSVKVMF